MKSDIVGLPEPTTFAIIVFVVVLLLVGYLLYVFRKGYQVLLSPNPDLIVILSILVFGYSYYMPIINAMFIWIWFTISGQKIPLTKLQEGFLVSPNDTPGVTEWVVTRRAFLDRLRRYLFSLELPHGIKCGTSPRKMAPKWEPSRILIHEYLKRIALTYPVNTNEKDMKNAEKLAVKSMDYICEERAIIEDIIDKMEVDPTIEYSYRDVRERISSLLKFYEKSKIKNRRSVDDILGLPLGEKDPYQESETNIVNSQRSMAGVLKTQSNLVGLRGGNDNEKIAPYLNIPSAQVE
jgi:hypothetical protein